MTGKVVISGCSGGGKSTLLEALARWGFATVSEPGRRIVRDEQINRGSALPWVDAEAFLHRAMEMATDDFAQVSDHPGWVFFDRSIVDAASGLSALKGLPVGRHLPETPAYYGLVFMAPPWPEIYTNDSERQHDFAAAVLEYQRLSRDYPALGFEIAELPMLDVDARVAFILERLGLAG